MEEKTYTQKELDEEFFAIKCLDAANTLSEEEFEHFQGLYRKVKLLTEKKQGPSLKESHQDMMQRFKEISKLSDIQRRLEEESGVKIMYHGLGDLNFDKTYPLFVQWNHPYPVISINLSSKCSFMLLPRGIGYALERLMGTVTDEADFEMKIQEFFKKKGEEK